MTLPIEITVDQLYKLWPEGHTPHKCWMGRVGTNSPTDKLYLADTREEVEEWLRRRHYA